MGQKEDKKRGPPVAGSIFPFTKKKYLCIFDPQPKAWRWNAWVVGGEEIIDCSWCFCVFSWVFLQVTVFLCGFYRLSSL